MQRMRKVLSGNKSNDESKKVNDKMIKRSLHQMQFQILLVFSGNMVLSNGQFEVHENETSKSELILSLTIRNVTIRNMGKYECVAKNPFGAAEANIRAYSKSRVTLGDYIGP